MLALARRLVEMPEGHLARLPLSDELTAPLQQARSTRKHVARKRETQYLAKCLRRSDSLESIRDALDAIDRNSRQSRAHFHKLEQLRDRLIATGDNAINELVGTNRNADRQKLRRLVQDARREQEQDRPPAASRKLFRYLREISSDDEA